MSSASWPSTTSSKLSPTSSTETVKTSASCAQRSETCSVPLSLEASSIFAGEVAVLVAPVMGQASPIDPGRASSKQDGPPTVQESDRGAVAHGARFRLLVARERPAMHAVCGKCSDLVRRELHRPLVGLDFRDGADRHGHLSPAPEMASLEDEMSDLIVVDQEPVDVADVLSVR